MALTALTDIKHGNADGSLVTYEAGEAIEDGHFSDNELAALVDVGSVGEPSFAVAPVDSETAALVEKLQAELAAAHAELEANGLDVPDEV